MGPREAQAHHHLVGHGRGIVRLGFLPADFDLGDELPQRQLPHPFQIGRCEEIFEGGGDPLLRVDFSFFEPFPEVFRGQIHVHDLIGLGNDSVGEAFPDFHPDEFLDRVVQAFQMLDVQRRDHVNPGRENFLDVLVTFSISASRHVGMGQFVDQDHGWPPGKHGIQIHFFDLDAPVFTDDSRHGLQTFQKFGDLGAAVGFGETHHDIEPFAFQRMTLLEHPICLPHAGAISEVNFETSALGTSDHL